MDKQKVDHSRRKLLQKTTVVGGVVAAGAWTKPSLNSVMLPAHAQMTVAPKTLAGATSNNPIVSTGSDKNDSVASQVLDVLVPTAKAGMVGFPDDCGSFTVNGPDDYTHCVDLVFDEEAAGSNFTLNLSGPDIYYGFYCYSADTAYYAGVKNLSGSTNGTLMGQDFTVTLGDFEFQGSVAGDFQTASGTVVQVSGARMSIGNHNVGSGASCETGYGAYWDVTDGGACSFGSGAYDSGRLLIIAGDNSVCPG